MSHATASSTALPIDQELVLKVIPMPGDCNANGDIFGGWVMAQVDLAGSVLPARYTQGRMATVAVNEFIFKQPVRVGDILSFFSKVVRVGRTSITVKVEVFAERFRNQGSYIKVTEALVTYVAIDDAGKPREIPKVWKKKSTLTDPWRASPINASSASPVTSAQGDPAFVIHWARASN